LPLQNYGARRAGGKKNLSLWDKKRKKGKEEKTERRGKLTRAGTVGPQSVTFISLSALRRLYITALGKLTSGGKRDGEKREERRGLRRRH